jgi:uncharacterized protein (DUF885 family)
MSKLNPRITTVEIGINSLREVTIYPLSLADQGKLAKILSAVFQKVMENLSHLSEEPEELDGSDESVGTIEKVALQLANLDIAESMCLVVAETEMISMGELDNDQFYDLVETIYKVNYERAPKNFVALWKGALTGILEEKSPAEKKMRRKVSHSRKPSPESAVGTTID